MGKIFDSVANAARAKFIENLSAFFRMTEGWTRASLLEVAGMDLGLIRRVYNGESFTVGALDKLQQVMEDIIDGKISPPVRKPRTIKPKPAKPKAKPQIQRVRKGEAYERRANG